MNLLKFLLHCCRNKIIYPAEKLHPAVEHLWTSCILATLPQQGHTHRNTWELHQFGSLGCSQVLQTPHKTLFGWFNAQVLCTSLCSAQTTWVISHDSKTHGYCFQLAQTHCSAALLYSSPHSELLCKHFQRQESQPRLSCILSKLNSFVIPILPP